MYLRNTTRMAWQAAIAISLAEMVSYIFQLERGYWVTLAAMALTTLTWGDSLKRSLERVSMTIIGGFFGTLLYWLIPENQYLILGLLLLFVFFTVYLFQIYHLLAMFALTGFVVFLFALFGEWNLLLLRDRILDTALGAVIALLVGRFFLTSKVDIVELFVAHIDKIQAILTLTFEPLHTTEIISTQHLYSNFQMIRKNAVTIRYEMIFQHINSRDFRLLLTQSAFCTQYVISLVDIYTWVKPHLTAAEKKDVDLAFKTTLHNLTVLERHLRKEAHDPAMRVVNLNELLIKAIKSEPQRFASLNSEALGFYNVMYFFARLNTRLNEIHFLLGKNQ